jgi:hypothetical protein
VVHHRALEIPEPRQLSHVRSSPWQLGQRTTDRRTSPMVTIRRR